MRHQVAAYFLDGTGDTHPGGIFGQTQGLAGLG